MFPKGVFVVVCMSSVSLFALGVCGVIPHPSGACLLCMTMKWQCQLCLQWRAPDGTQYPEQPASNQPVPNPQPSSSPVPAPASTRHGAADEAASSTNLVVVPVNSAVAAVEVRSKERIMSRLSVPATCCLLLLSVCAFGTCGFCFFYQCAWPVQDGFA